MAPEFSAENGTKPVDVENHSKPDRLDLELLIPWLGKKEVRVDEVTRSPVRALSATLDHEPIADLSGYTLPPLWHWMYFQSSSVNSELARDGHAKKGGFLPPVALPRRMWAGGRVEFMVPLTMGSEIQRVSTIMDIKHKTGASGELVFVSVNHDINIDTRLAIRERQDLVYRDSRKKDAPHPRQIQTPHQAQWSRTVEPTVALLFRYSALTFNAHRIHYDRGYAIGVEGYDDLVVHAPLVATLLLDLIVEKCPGVVIHWFDYRAIRPLLATGSFKVQACVVSGVPGELPQQSERKLVRLWAKDADGWLTMNAKAQVTMQVNGD